MAFYYQTFYRGRLSNDPDHSISDHLNTKQVKVCCSFWKWKETWKMGEKVGFKDF